MPTDQTAQEVLDELDHAEWDAMTVEERAAWDALRDLTATTQVAYADRVQAARVDRVADAIFRTLADIEGPITPHLMREVATAAIAAATEPLCVTCGEPMDAPACYVGGHTIHGGVKAGRRAAEAADRG